MFSAVTFVQGLNEGFTSRVVFTTPLPSEHPDLLDSLRTRSGLVMLGTEEDSLAPPPVAEEAEAVERLRAGEVDAVVAFLAPRGQEAELAGNFRVAIQYDRAEERSQRARDRVESVVEDYRRAWILKEALALGMDEAERVQFAVASENVSTSEDLGAMVLGQMMSFFIIIMVALGCFVPSVDTTAGERERSTWETLMTVAAPRSAVVTAKYLYVATLGITAGMLNVLALFASIGAVVRPLLAQAQGPDAEIVFNVEPMAAVVMLAGAVALALFFAASMMILASFARTFKDGQAMVQPVYYLVFIPFLLGQQTDRTLTPAVASIPVANISMMIRDAFNGIYNWPLIAQSLAVTLATVVLCLLAARYVLRFEDFLMGSFDGSLWRFLKDRMGRKNPTKESA
jgi:sodium transport system permease protein